MEGDPFPRESLVQWDIGSQRPEGCSPFICIPERQGMDKGHPPQSSLRIFLWDREIEPLKDTQGTVPWPSTWTSGGFRMDF